MIIHLSEAELIDFLNDDVPAAAAERMRAHLSECEPCRMALAQFRELTARLREQPRQELPASLSGRLDAFLAGLTVLPAAAPAGTAFWRRNTGLWCLLSAAMLALGIGVGLGLRGPSRSLLSSQSELPRRRPAQQRPAGIVSERPGPAPGGPVASPQQGVPRPAEGTALADQQVRVADAQTGADVRAAPALSATGVAVGSGALRAPGSVESAGPCAGEEAVTTEGSTAVAQVMLARGAPVAYSGADDPGAILTAGTELTVGQAVHTGPTDQLKLRLADGAQIEHSFGTTIRFLRSLETFDSPTRMALTEGEIWVWAPGDGTGVQIEAQPARVNMARGEATVAAHRGRLATATTVHALRGQLTVTAGEQSETIPPGQAVVVTGDGQIQQRSPARLAEIVRTGPAWKVKHHELWLAPTLSFNELLVQWAAPRMELGIQVAPVVEGQGGLEIYQVAAHAPAAVNGVQAGDVLLSWGDHEAQSATDFIAGQLNQVAAGQVDLRIRRDKEELTIPAKFSHREPPFAWAADIGDPMTAATRAIADRELELAKVYLLEAVASNPECPAVYFNLGLLEEYAAHWSAALAAYHQAAQYAPDSGLLKLCAGRVLLGVGNLRGASDELQQAVGLDPALSEAWYLLGYAQLMRGDSEAAQTQANWLVSRAESKAAGHCLWGQIAQLSGRPDEAAAHYEQALSYNLFHSYAALGLAQIEDIRGEPIKSQQLAQQVYRWGPAHAGMPSWRAAILIAGIHFERQEYESCEAWLRRTRVGPGGKRHSGQSG